MRTPLTITEDRVAETIRTIQSLAKKEAVIGIPEATSSRPGEEATNAELGFIHEFGSPANNIPARPFLIPGVQKAQAKAAEILLDGARETLNKKTPIEQALQRAGVLAANAVKRIFTDPANGWAPNAPETVRRKGSSRPLIDTAEMRRSVTSAVVDK